MKLEQDAAGDVTVELGLLAQRFDIPVAALRRLMGQGQLQSRVEIGDGDDAGRRRITLRCGNRIWQAVLDASGQVVSEEVRHVRATGNASRAPGHGVSGVKG